MESEPSKWEHYQHLVLTEIKRNNSNYEKLQSKVDKIHIDLVQIKTTMRIRAAIVSFLAGGIGTAVGILVESMKNK